MNNYELVILIDPRISADDQKSVKAEIDGVIKQYVKKSDDMGLQELAYDIARIRGNNKAYVMSFLLAMDAATAKTLQEQFKYFKGLLRVKLFKLTTEKYFHMSTELAKKTKEYEETLNEKSLVVKTSFFTDPKNAEYVTWKAAALLKHQTTRFANIKPKEFTSLSVAQQKKIRQAVLRARELAFLPYVR